MKGEHTQRITGDQLSPLSRSLKEVQEYPEDFDGVVIGSPANWFTHLTGWSLYMNQIVQPATSSRFLTPSEWSDIVAPEVMKQCDALDGVKSFTISLRSMLIVPFSWKMESSTTRVCESACAPTTRYATC